MKGVSGGLLHAVLFFKNTVQGISFFLPGNSGGRGFGGISEGKVVAKVAPILYEHPLGLCFPALVIGFLIIETAVETTAQIRAALRAGLASARFFRNRKRVFTGVTGLHTHTIHHENARFNVFRAGLIPPVVLFP
jgi:hypothetical protein